MDLRGGELYRRALLVDSGNMQRSFTGGGRAGRWDVVVRRIFWSLGGLLSVMTLGSLGGRFLWLLDVLTHYHLQYTVGLTFCVVGLLLLRSWRTGLLVLVAALGINLYLLIPFFLPAQATHVALARAPDGPALRVMAMNISTGTAGYRQVVELIRERSPDVVFMSEVRADLVAILQEQLADSYPHLHAVPSRFTLGIAFLSRHPFQSIETVTLSGRGRRFLHAEIAWQGRPVTLVGIHPLPPFDGEWVQSRNSELQHMGELANNAEQPFILIGDLNASPWSWPMRQLLAQTNLRYAAKGYGVWPTWRLAGPILGAPLDHILISPHWSVAHYREEGDISSDHIPIQADLVLQGD